MAEEHRCQAPRLCINNCGFFGSPTTQNLCSKCYKDLQLEEQQQVSINQTLMASSSTSSSMASVAPEAFFATPSSFEAKEVASTMPREAEAATAATTTNRCLMCRCRVGLTGFKCRCGMTFCGTHRYAEQHECSFDFKGFGKDQIAKANPVVKAEKLRKI